MLAAPLHSPHTTHWLTPPGTCLHSALKAVPSVFPAQSALQLVFRMLPLQGTLLPPCMRYHALRKSAMLSLLVGLGGTPWHALTVHFPLLEYVHESLPLQLAV